MRLVKIVVLVSFLATSAGCQKYLDVVPDNVATIDYAFRLRVTAQRYLATCYSFMPKMGDMYANPGLFGGDELWLSSDKLWWNNWMVALGTQNINNPVLDYWNGANNATALWTGISQCNIFLDNIQKVPDIDEVERAQWIGEVKFLKAYYHFFLLRMYGPIPIIKENLPISASVDEVQVERRPVDEVFEYIVTLLDEASATLWDNLRDESSELGHITKPIAVSMKAKVLVYAASPLFNGNTDYAGFTNKEGTALFNTQYDASKWQRAAEACKEAIDLCHSLGYKLYEFQPSTQTQNISDETKLGLVVRGTLTDRVNSELIWANTGSATRDLQVWSAPRALLPSQVGNQEPNGSIGATLKVANLFYSKNGVPINEDITYDYAGRFNLRVGTEAERYHIKQGYTTAQLNFDREPRYYGALGFDGGIWYGQSQYNEDNSYWLEIKKDQWGGKIGTGWHSVTGYYVKKYIHFTNTSVSTGNYTTTNWPWVMLRLGDLYLLYAEALNETDGSRSEIFDYLDQIRAKAGLPGVVEAWTNFSRTPDKVNSKSGIQQIIHQERAIELAFEGERFWDLRRWKTAPDELNRNVTGWDVDQATNEAYYRERILFNQVFSLKDYFWPIRERDLIVNKNLVQNPGW